MRTRNMFTALALSLGMSCLPGCGSDHYALLGGTDQSALAGRVVQSDVANASVDASVDAGQVGSETALANEAALADEAAPVVRYSKSRYRRPPRQSRARRREYQSVAAPIQTVTVPVTDSGTIAYAAGAPVSPIDYTPAVVIGPDGTSVSSTTYGTPVLSAPVYTAPAPAPVAVAPARVQGTRPVVVVETPVLAPPPAPVQVPGKIVTTNVLGYPQKARVSYRRGKGPRRVTKTTRVVAAPTVASVAATTVQYDNGVTEAYVPNPTPAIVSTEVYNIQDVTDETGQTSVASAESTTITSEPIEAEPSYAKYLVDYNDGTSYDASSLDFGTGPVVQSEPIPAGTPYIAYDVYEPSSAGMGQPMAPIAYDMSSAPIMVDQYGAIVPEAWRVDPAVIQAGVQDAMQPVTQVTIDPLAQPLTDPYASAFVQPGSLVPGGMLGTGAPGEAYPVIQPVVIQPVIQPVIHAAGLPYGQVMGTAVQAPAQYYGVMPGQEGLTPMPQPTAVVPYFPGQVGPGYAAVGSFCGPLLLNPAVCAPGQNLSECFTLTDYQVQNSQIYMPTAQGPLDFQAAPVPAAAAVASVQETAPVMPTEPVASAVIPPMPAAPVAPVSPVAPARPAAPVSPVVQPVQPTAPVAAPAPAAVPVPLPPPAEVLSSKYAGLPDPTPTTAPIRNDLTPPSVSMPPPLGSRDNIPPVPAASVIENALEAMTGDDIQPYLK